MKYYKLVYFVPEYALEKTKHALFEKGVGAGFRERYDQVCWETQGLAQFRPLEGANPELGQQGRLCHVPEFRVETILAHGIMKDSIAALRAVHPYECPAIEVYELVYPDHSDDL